MKLIHTNSDEKYTINVYETNTYMYITHVLVDNELFTLPRNPNKKRAVLIADRLLDMISIAYHEGYHFNGQYFVHPKGIEIPVFYALNLDVSISNFKNTLWKEVYYLPN